MQATRTSKKANADCARHLPKHDLKDWLASARTLLEREQAELAILEPALRPESFHSDGLPLSLHPRELKRVIEELKAVIKFAETDAEVLKAIKLNEQILKFESDLCTKTGLAEVPKNSGDRAAKMDAETDVDGTEAGH